MSRRKNKELPPLVALYPYQHRWIDDHSRFKLAVKSARTGFSFATGIEAILDCLKNPGTTWTVLSASDAQSVEFADLAQKNINAMGEVAKAYDEPFADQIGETSFTQHRNQFPNGSRIIALPANPRTARGYPGNAILDEFAHHQDSYSIWAAVTRQVALGHKLRVLSTPNGEQGKFYDLAKMLGLTDGFAAAADPVFKDGWSGHFLDVHMAVVEGCPIDPEEMRRMIQDDEIYGQEFLCLFNKISGAWLELALIQRCESDNATTELPEGYEPQGWFSLGIDVGRYGDRTVAWLDEVVAGISITRMVLRLHGMPFPEQEDTLDPWVKLSRRTAMDATGIGAGMFDHLVKRNPGKVMGVNFGGKSDRRDKKKKKAEARVNMKIDLALRIKERMERGLSLIPYDPEIRASLQAIKRENTASGVRFEAPRVEVHSAIIGGRKKKVFEHADDFWAKALADFATEAGSNLSVEIQSGERKTEASRLGSSFGNDRAAGSLAGVF